MSYLEPGPHRRNDDIAVIDREQEQEAVVPAGRASLRQRVHGIRLSRRGRVVCVLLLFLTAFSLMFGLFRPALFSLIGLREQGDSLQNHQGTPSLATPAVRVSSDPLVEVSATNETVYALAPDGLLRAWSLPLRESLWQHRTEALPYHALLVGEQEIFTLVWDARRAWLEAWRASDGRRLWAHDLPVPGPDPLLLRGKNLYVNTHNGTLFALHARSGYRVWSFETGVSRPLSAFFFATEHVAQVLLRDGEVSVVRTSDGVQIYRYKSAHYSLFPVVQSDYDIAYIHQPGDVVQAVRISDGLPLWRFPRESTISLLPTVVNDGVVYVSQESGWLKALRGDDGEQLWQYHVEAGFSSAPVVRNGMVYIAGKDGVLWALRASDGGMLWHTDPARVRGQFVATDQIVYLNVDLPGQEMYALQGNDGHELWHHSITTVQTLYWSPVIDDDMLIFGPDSVSLQAWSGSSGQFLWQYRANAQIHWEPFCDTEYIYVTHQNGSVAVLGRHSGEPLWQYTFSNR